jgi:DNA-binding response OmpR family regulator
VGNRSRRVLVIAAELDIADLLARHLEELGCEVDTCRDGNTGISRALDGTAWSLLVLDRGPAGLDGLHIARKVRGSANYAPILMLGARSSELDLVLGLESGADDYVGKPVSVVEFAARAKAMLRRAEWLAREAPAQSSVLRNGDLEIEPDKRIARRDGCELSLTAKEFDLLAYLMRHPLRVFTRAQLLDQVWGSTCVSFEHTVNSHINRLRAKLEPCPARPRYVHTVWGVGYRLCPSPGTAQIGDGHA